MHFLLAQFLCVVCTHSDPSRSIMKIPLMGSLVQLFGQSDAEKASLKHGSKPNSTLRTPSSKFEMARIGKQLLIIALLNSGV